MHILILCAGLGKRLEHKTKNKPKCLVKVNKNTILGRLLGQLSTVGVEKSKIILCSGYQKEKLPKDYLQIHNKLYASTNMVYTLMQAFTELEELFLQKKETALIIYGDCLYDINILKTIIKYDLIEEDIALPIDKKWLEQWKLRYENPYEDAETLIYKLDNNRLLNIGEKTFEPKDYMGQYMGIFKIKGDSLKLFVNEYKNLPELCRNKISTTEFINLTLKKIHYKVIPTFYKWSEVDNLQDLSIAESKF
tara:strand:+ start:584 stop:1333 length:750 start_codon:yes stop_codon:yes gene_type:complete